MHNNETCDEWSHNHKTENYGVDFKVRLKREFRSGYILGALSAIFILVVFNFVSHSW